VVRQAEEVGMTALTLPGDIPGLLQQGSPVGHPDVTGVRCVIIALHGNDRTARVGFPWTINDEDADTWPLSELHLSLESPTGRAHAAWWLAEKWGKPGPAHLGLAVLGRGWQITAGVWGVWLLPSGPFDELGMEPPASNILRVPSLSSLDPHDPRTLPDGSRWVDVEALRRVVLHGAGRTA